MTKVIPTITWLETPKLIVKGFCMGIADVIPGISGGTIAFILGIYEEFILSIKSFDVDFLKKVLRGRWREAVDTVAWRYLGCILVGIVAAFATLAKPISWLFHHHPEYLLSFFFGLIVATIPLIARIVPKWDLLKVVLLLVTAGLTHLIVNLVPVSTPNTALMLFLSGAIAISAMILPGISGSFILVILGKYHVILEAVSDYDFRTIFIFLLGIGTGVVTFVRVLSWLFKRYHDTTIVILTGFVLGSLSKVWPWKITLETTMTSKGKEIPLLQSNTLPGELSGEVIFALVLMATGFLLAYVLQRTQSASGFKSV